MSLFQCLRSNPCALVGLSLYKGSEYVAAILVIYKTINFMVVNGIWVYLALDYTFRQGMQDGPYNHELVVLHELFTEACWTCADAVIGYAVDLILLHGIWSKNKHYLSFWLMTFAMRGVRFTLIDARRPYYWREFFLAASAYWIIVLFVLEIEEEEVRLGVQFERPPIHVFFLFFGVGLFEVFISIVKPAPEHADPVNANVRGNGPPLEVF